MCPLVMSLVMSLVTRVDYIYFSGNDAFDNTVHLRNKKIMHASAFPFRCIFLGLLMYGAKNNETTKKINRWLEITQHRCAEGSKRSSYSCTSLRQGSIAVQIRCSVILLWFYNFLRLQQYDILATILVCVQDKFLGHGGRIQHLASQRGHPCWIRREKI